MAVAALVLGIVGILGGWCTFAIPCILAVIFGYIGIGQTRGGARSGRGMAIAGFVLGLVPVGVLSLILVFGGIGVLMAPVSSVTSKISDDKSTGKSQIKGIVVAMEPLTINLADGHYLKLGVSLQQSAEQGTVQVDTTEAVNIVVDTYTGRSLVSLNTVDGRAAAKQQLLGKLHAAYKGAVMDVYITQFVTQ